jgi:hypothetical protein
MSRRRGQRTEIKGQMSEIRKRTSDEVKRHEKRMVRAVVYTSDGRDRP